jgi:hypothetical protein
MKPYDVAESPPAPMADCQVQNPVSKAVKGQKGKLDTGAAGTVIPVTIVDELGLMPVGERVMYDYKGNPELHDTFYVNISLDGNSFDWVEVISTN